jgi:ankyrin repeat protein
MIITEYDILFKKYILDHNEQECIELVKKYDINMKYIMNDYNNNSLFMFICSNGYRKLISTILNKYKFDNNIFTRQNNDGKNALMLLCENSIEYIIVRIFDLYKFTDEELNIKDNECNHLLYYSCNYRLTNISFILLTQNIDLCCKNTNNETPFINAVKLGLSSEAKEMLKHIRYGNNNNFLKIIYNDFSPLMVAIDNQELDLSLFIIKNFNYYDILLNYKNNEGLTAIMIACEYGFIGLSLEILSIGKTYGNKAISLNSENSEGNTALIYACRLTSPLLALEILEFGNEISNIEAININGHTAYDIVFNNYHITNTNILNKMNEMLNNTSFYNQTFENPKTNLNSKISIELAISCLNEENNHNKLDSLVKIASDPILIEEDMCVKEYIESCNDNIIFQYKNSYFMSKKSMIQNMKEKAIYYEYSNRKIYTENPLYHMNKIGINIGFVYYEHIEKIIHPQCKKQIYVLRNTPLKIINSVISNKDILEDKLNYLYEINNIYMIL